MDTVARQILPERMYVQLKDGREVDFGYTVANFGRFRVNMFLALGAIRAVMRVIASKSPQFEELGLPPVLARLAMARRGMVLVTGITGAGKSTTLTAMIDYMNRHRNDHIITIEDPVEFIHDDINCVFSQREIGYDSPSFATALRAALREDPDVILVGEMRDPETMTVALHAAETGHLVLSTLHTLNATETVNRIMTMFPPYQEQQIRDQLAAVIQGVVSQRLIPRLGGKGRVPAVEVMIGTAAIRECIREAKRTRRDPRVHRPGGIAVRHAELRPVPAEALSRRRHRLRDGEGKRVEPRRLRPQGAGHLLDGRADFRDRAAEDGGGVAQAGRPEPVQPKIAAPTPPLDTRRARLVAADLLSRHAWTRAELTRRLRRRGAPPDVAADVVTDLAGRGHVDDAAFARHWVETRSARGYGAARLRAELRAWRRPAPDRRRARHAHERPHARPGPRRRRAPASVPPPR